MAEVLNNTATTRVIMDPARVAAFCRSPDGPVVAALMRRADRVQQAARKQIRMGHIGGGVTGIGPGPVPRHGNLRDTIVKRLTERNGWPCVQVGSEDPIALIHHEGTRPHVILPRIKTALVFSVGGQTVVARRVNHPGTKPNRYLTDNLRLAVE